MRIDVAASKFSFAFAPQVSGFFGDGTTGLCGRGDASLGNPGGRVTAMGQECSGRLDLDALVNEFPALFSPVLGTANCEAYEIELCDSTPVQSPPYRCAPPKLSALRSVVGELLDQGVIRNSKSPYASPAFLIPKSGGGHRLVVDYRKVNAKVKFDS
jgi:hypothetical protein